MLKIWIMAIMTWLVSLCSSIALGGDFDFLRSIDAQARSDIREFTKQMSIGFGLPAPQVDVIIKNVPNPSDAFMIIKIGRLTNRRTDEVLRVFNANRSKGWGVIAKEMGIKPGSKEFHDLKKAPNLFSGSSKNKGRGREKKNKKK